MNLQSFFDTPAKSIISENVKIIEINKLPMLVVSHRYCQAVIALQGGQLLLWQPSEQKPVIWLSENAIFDKNVAIRGGIPICWPWFGKIKSPPHGFVRTEIWSLLSCKESQEQISICLNLASNTLWDYPFDLTVTFKLGSRCFIELDAKGDFSTTAALHSYFYVQNITDTVISGVGKNYEDRLLSTSSSDDNNDKLMINQEVDRIYTTPQQVTTIDDKVLRRRIKLTHYGASDVVVWNPWQSAQMIEDMSAEGYKSMLCVETAKINQPLISTPTSSAKLGLQIETEMY